MKSILRLVTKVIGFILLLQAITSGSYLVSILFFARENQTELLLSQLVTCLVFLGISVVFLTSPGFLIRLLGTTSDETRITIDLNPSILQLGIILIGLYFAADSGAVVCSFLLRQLIALGFHDASSVQVSGREIANQTTRAISLLFGLVMVFRSSSILKLVWKNEGRDNRSPRIDEE